MEDVAHGEGEQIFDTQADEGTETTNDTEETGGHSEVNSDAKNSGSEQSDALNLNEQKDSTDGNGVNEHQAKQVAAWQGKIDRGEATLEDLPPAQKWMEGKLKPKQPEVDPKELARQAALEVMKEQQEKSSFESLKSQVRSLSLTKSQAQNVEDSFASLTKKGLSRLDALETAIQIAGVDLTGVEEMRRKMRKPVPGGSSDASSVLDRPYSEVHKSVPEAKRQAHLKSLVSN